ncbi:MAG: hypothetical protein JXR60_00920 [Bacteroidales bacterium]|nr:hypothetical protein [Bacteroidales bacterium]
MFQSCGNSVSKGKEGIIHYELIYIDGENSNPIITFLPNSMTYAFKKNKTVQKVEGWGGVFKMVGISDTKTDSVTALMKILGDKFKYRCRLGQDSFGYDPLEGAKIEYVDGEKLIAGLKCKKALAKTNDEQYELYYTEDLKIDDANWNTPFKTVKGVLMEYQIKMFNIKTKVIAKEVERIEVADDEFDIPEGYKCVSKEKIEESVYKFM